MKQVIKILKIGRVGSDSEVDWYDFCEVPQGYIKINGTPVPNPKGARKFKKVNGLLVDPTEEQVIDYAKRLMSRTDLMGQTSGKNPDDYVFEVTSKDFRKENKNWIKKTKNIMTVSMV